MTGWLPKEILDHLKHAGYMAVPEECIELLQVQELVSDEELLRAQHFNDTPDFQIAQRRRIAMQMAAMLRDKGFIDVQLSEPAPHGATAHRARLYVIKPRTISRD